MFAGNYLKKKSHKLIFFTACISMIGCGGYMAWTSPSLPHLMSKDSEVPITKSQGAWIQSLYTFGAVFGCLLNPHFVDRLGRKYSLLIFAIPQVTGWILIILAENFTGIFIARFVAGVGHGALFNLVVIYIGEIADKSIRGILITIMKISINFGSLTVTIAGAYLSYDTLNFVSLFIPILFIATFSFMPETPYFYLQQNKDDEATKSLMTLRWIQNEEFVRSDIVKMKESLVEDQQSSKRGSLRELIGTKGNRRGLLILFCVKATQQFSGAIAIVAYAQEIFSHSDFALSPQNSVIVLTGTQLIAGIAAVGLVDRAGRRILFLVSGLLASLSLAAVGLFFFLKYHLEVDVSSITWIPLVALVSYEVTCAMGIATIPYVLLGELFPMKVKGLAVAFGMILGSLFAFLVGLGFQTLNMFGGIHTTFWTFAVSCLLGTLIVYWITPETKGKSLEEIQAILNPIRKKNERVPS